MAHEVAHVELFPQCLVRHVGQRLQGQQREGLALARLDHGALVRCATAERAQRGAVEVFQQPALPAVPDLRAGASDVGDRQQVERSQMAFVLDDVDECADHVGI